MRNPFEPIVRSWRNWRTARGNAASFRHCGSEETRRIAQDLGVSEPELRVLASKWPDAADLLNRRLAALGLDQADIRRRDGQVLPDLQRVCTLCLSGRECRGDLDRDASDPVWRDYCPNVTTLDALVAERARRRKAG